jgi:hypothetical protein
MWSHSAGTPGDVPGVGAGVGVGIAVGAGVGAEVGVGVGVMNGVGAVDSAVPEAQPAASNTAARQAPTPDCSPEPRTTHLPGRLSPGGSVSPVARRGPRRPWHGPRVAASRNRGNASRRRL